MFRLGDDAKKGNFLFHTAVRKEFKEPTMIGGAFGRNLGFFSRFNETNTSAPLMPLGNSFMEIGSTTCRECPIIHKYARAGMIVRDVRFNTPLACTEIQRSN